MKKLLLPILVCLAPFIYKAQEVNNAGFENWELINGWNETPVDWLTLNSQLVESVFKDDEPYSGDWAMRVTPVPDGIGLHGTASTQVDINYIPVSLNFYAKWQKDPTCAAWVTVTFYNEESQIYTETWSTTSDQSGWTEINLLFSPIQPIITHAIIKVEVSVGDLAPGNGWLSIDDVGFSNTVSINEFDDLELQVYPNPSSELVNITYPNGNIVDAIVSVYDSKGSLVFSEKNVTTIDVSTWAEGLYSLKLQDGENEVTESIVVKR